MRPRQATLAAPLAYANWAGIDPGGDTGVVVLRVAITGPDAHDIQRARLVHVGTIAASSSVALTGAARRRTMVSRVREILYRHSVTHCVLEEPSTQTNSWRGAQEEGRATGSLFYLGAHFGLCLAATAYLPWECRVWAYPPTSPAKKKERREKDTGELVMGWMQGRATRPTPKSLTLHAMSALLTQLKQRPASGQLPTLEQIRQLHNEHERMALGVLNFHLQRERGAL